MFIPSLILLVALFALIKSADLLLSGAQRLGLSFGLSSFTIGIIIVGIGTSLPELVSSFAAILKNAPEIVPANAIGSNVANILLIVGIAALVGRSLSVTKNLIDVDLPMLSIGTVLFLGAAWDGVIERGESVLLMAGFVIHLLYVMYYKEEVVLSVPEKNPDTVNDDGEESFIDQIEDTREGEIKTEFKWIDVLYIALGAIGLAIASNYTITSVITLSELLSIGAGVIAISVVAVGTSLPELVVSVKAAHQGESEMALGNIFGSNAFNIFVVVGLPGLFTALPIDPQTLKLGLPALVLATLLFVISGISKKISMWEGAMYLLLYAFFIFQLFLIQ